MDGIFGARTEASVRKFQEVFNLLVDGIVGRATWYALVRYYIAVTRMAELRSQGQKYYNNSWATTDPINQGDRGIKVEHLQYMLSVLAEFIPQIPDLTIDGIFGPATTAAVRAFQELVGLPADGIVGLQTFLRIQQAYEDILATLPPGIEGDRAKPFPGFLLSEGQEGEAVRDLQTYLRGIAEYTGVIPVIPVTGYFGTQTRDAVIALQAQNDIPANGAVGPVTWNLIRQLYDSR